MAVSRNLLPTDFGWVHELAKNELNPDASSVFNQLSSIDPKQMIEESTIQFLEELRDLFTANSKAFNSYSENAAKFSEVKIYGITNSAADFMIFRNNIKLVFSNSTHGIINVSFTQHIRGDLSIDGSTVDSQSSDQIRKPLIGKENSQDILAQIGPFFDVTWTYQGEKVNPERLVKFYFIEFIKISRNIKKESGNQMLLKQIKALLQDKGIDL